MNTTHPQNSKCNFFLSLCYENHSSRNNSAQRVRLSLKDVFSKQISQVVFLFFCIDVFYFTVGTCSKLQSYNRLKFLNIPNLPFRMISYILKCLKRSFLVALYTLNFILYTLSQAMKNFADRYCLQQI